MYTRQKLEDHMKYFGKVAAAVLAASLLAGCSSSPGSSSGAAGEVTTQTALESAQSAYQQWRNKVVGAEALQRYSPDKYSAMMASWQRADALLKAMQLSPESAQQSYSLFSSETNLERFYADIRLVEQHYKQLKALKKVADDVLEPAMVQVAYLNSIDANAYYRSEFVRLNRFYDRLFALVHAGDLNDAQDEQKEFLDRAHSLEVRVIKRIYIAPEEEALRELKNNDVRFYAPASYARVEAEIAAGKSLIDLSPRAFDAINQAVSAIQFELAHARHIAGEVKSLRDLSRDEYEEYILGIEDRLLTISQSLSDEDLRDMPLASQAEHIQQGVVKLRRLPGAPEPLPASHDRLENLHLMLKQQHAQISELQQQLSQLTRSPESTSQQ